MRKDSFVKFHLKASTDFSVNRPNFAQKSSSLALNTREFHEDYKEIPGFALGNTEIKKMRKKKSGLVVSILVSHGLQIPLPPRDQETPRDNFVSPCLMLSPQENMRLQETTIPLLFWAFFLIFCISKSKTRNFFVILMKFSCV